MHMDLGTGVHGDMETQRDKGTGAWGQGDTVAWGHRDERTERDVAQVDKPY